MYNLSHKKKYSYANKFAAGQTDVDCLSGVV